MEENTMKKLNKRWMALSVFTLVLVLGTAGVAISGFKGGFGGGPFHGKGFKKERVLSRLDYTVQELKLTAQQQIKYGIIRTKMSKGLEAAATRHDEIKDFLHTELGAEQPDIKMIAETMKKNIRTMPDYATMQIDYMMEVYDILTPAQQKELTAMIKERMEKHGRRGFRHHGDKDGDREGGDEDRS